METTLQAVQGQIALIDLNEKISLKLLAEKINELIEAQNATKPAARNRGPESERVMTEDDARRILLGDLKDASHTVAATELGLSYGQIYSARKGFTFKPVYQEWRKAQ